MSDQIELYAPKPGSLPWRILKHLQGQPEGTELGRRAIGSIFAVDNTSSLDTLLQLACARGVLAKGRNSFGEVTWKLGRVECVLVNARPVEETPTAREEVTVAVLAPAAGKWSPSTPRALPVAPPQIVLVVHEPVADVPMVTHSTTESLDQAFAEVFGDAARVQHAAQPEALPQEPVAVEPDAPAHATAPATPVPQRKPKRGTAPAKPRPAAKPYLAEIRPQPLNDPTKREAEQYATWLAGFGIGHSADFRLAHVKAVEGAVAAFTARKKSRFRIAKLSQYRAGIERTA